MTTIYTIGESTNIIDLTLKEGWKCPVALSAEQLARLKQIHFAKPSSLIDTIQPLSGTMERIDKAFTDALTGSNSQEGYRQIFAQKCQDDINEIKRLNSEWGWSWRYTAGGGVAGGLVGYVITAFPVATRIASAAYSLIALGQDYFSSHTPALPSTPPTNNEPPPSSVSAPSNPLANTTPTLPPLRDRNKDFRDLEDAINGIKSDALKFTPTNCLNDIRTKIETGQSYQAELDALIATLKDKKSRFHCDGLKDAYKVAKDFPKDIKLPPPPPPVQTPSTSTTPQTPSASENPQTPPPSKSTPKSGSKQLSRMSGGKGKGDLVRNHSKKPSTPAQNTNTPAQSTNTPAQSTNTPAQNPSTPAQSSKTPAQSSNTPPQNPNTPPQNPNTPAQNSNTPGSENTPPPTSYLNYFPVALGAAGGGYLAHKNYTTHENYKLGSKHRAEYLSGEFCDKELRRLEDTVQLIHRRCQELIPEIRGEQLTFYDPKIVELMQINKLFNAINRTHRLVILNNEAVLKLSNEDRLADGMVTMNDRLSVYEPRAL